MVEMVSSTRAYYRSCRFVGLFIVGYIFIVLLHVNSEYNQ